jgi:hypothetical protein
MINLLKLDKHIKLTLLIYIGICGILYYFKPSLMFRKDGSFKQFSIGNKYESTIFPYWLVCTFMGFMAYYVIIVCNSDYL